jgi:hypothetical protein
MPVFGVIPLLDPRNKLALLGSPRAFVCTTTCPMNDCTNLELSLAFSTVPTYDYSETTSQL